MTEAKEISWLALGVCFLLLIIPFVIFRIYRVPIWKNALISLARMTGQLILIGVFLEFLFEKDNPWLTLGWLLLMVAFATHSALNNSDLRIWRFFPLAFLAFLIAGFGILAYFNLFVLNLKEVLAARYVIAVGGMLLGNSLKGIIIGINNFYTFIRENESRHQFYLAAGATKSEALRPFLRRSLSEALKPTVASLATMGIVFLPGVMTGQILSGTDPLLAIKYQIAIILIIFVATTLSITLALLFSFRLGFDEYGVLKRDIFRKK